MSDKLTAGDLFLVQENVRLEQERTIAGLHAMVEDLTRENYRMHLLYEIKPPEKNALERIEELTECLQDILDHTAYAIGEEPYATADRLLAESRETP